MELSHTDTVEGDYAGILARGGTVVAATKGSSMRPLLREGRTAVVVEPVRHEPRVGDMPLYRRADGLYVVHRIVGVEADAYRIMGDNCTVRETVPKDSVLGLVTEIRYGSKVVSVADRGYRAYVWLWLLLSPPRVAVCRCLAYLRRARLRLRRRRKGKLLALAFADSPGECTSRLLDALERGRARATFFLVGQSVAAHADEVRRMARMGCELGNLTYSHAMLHGMGDGDVRREWERCDSAVRKVTGRLPTLALCPYFRYDAHMLEWMRLPLVKPSRNTCDWRVADPALIAGRVEKNAYDGAIVLLHDSHQVTAEAVERLVPSLAGMGYRLVTVSEMARLRGVRLMPGRCYRDIRRRE